MAAPHPAGGVVVCLGEALVDFVPERLGLDLVDCPGFKKAPGGAPANVAAGVARLGVPSRFLGKVGQDAFGIYLERSIRESGVDTSHLRFDGEYLTGLAFVSLTATGVPDFLFYRRPGADMMLRADEITAEAMEG